MLFVATLKPIGGTFEERLKRRLNWQHPGGVRPVAEYWVMGGEVAVIAIFESDSAASVMELLAPWADMFAFSVAPAVMADEGMALSRQMMGG